MLVFSVLLVFPKSIADEAKEALVVCVERVIPSLFPFMVTSRLLATAGVTVRAGMLMSGVLSPIFGIDGVLCGAFLSGLFGGFPSGAYAVGEAYSGGLCTRKNAERAVALSNNCSVAFVLSSVGVGVLGSVKNGIILLVSEVICTILLSRILRLFFGKTDGGISDVMPSLGNGKAIEKICQSVTDSASGTVSICGFVTVFYVFSGVLSAFFKEASTVAIIRGIFEACSGASEAVTVEFPLNFVICSFIVGFSGLSVIFQVTDVCEKYGISAKEFVVGRAINAILMPIVTVVLLLILPSESICVFSGSFSDFASSAGNSSAVLYAVFFAGVMAVMAFVYSFLCKMLKKRTNRHRFIKNMQFRY